VHQAERDQGLREGPSTAEQDRVKALEREVRELRRANCHRRIETPHFGRLKFPQLSDS
jgi:hypothetical protein